MIEFKKSKNGWSALLVIDDAIRATLSPRDQERETHIFLGQCIQESTWQTTSRNNRVYWRAKRPTGPYVGTTYRTRADAAAALESWMRDFYGWEKAHD